MSKTEYPRQIFSTIHKTSKGTKTISVDNFLQSPSGESETRKPTPPLEMHEGFSLFKIHLINSEGGKSKILSVNLPAKEVPFIHKRTCLIMQDNLKGGNLESLTGGSVKKEETKSLAYTYTFGSGTFSGKTPIQVLLESKDNESKLLSQKKWASDNLHKYEGKSFYNQVRDQIPAIEEAIELLKSGKLNAENAEIVNNNLITIYESPAKNCKPLDKEGRYTVYKLKIVYDKTKTLPIGIEMMNCFCPVDKSKGNVILLKEAVNKEVENIRLTEEEWYMMIDSMKAQKIMFEDYTYKKQFELSQKIIKETFDESKTK